MDIVAFVVDLLDGADNACSAGTYKIIMEQIGTDRFEFSKHVPENAMRNGSGRRR